MAQEVKDDNFKQEVLEADKPVFVDFYAPWCGPCKMMDPIIEELSERYKDKVKIVKLNVDENPQTAGAYQVMSIPTSFVFKNGEVVDQMIGFQDKGVLTEKFDNLS